MKRYVSMLLALLLAMTALTGCTGQNAAGADAGEDSSQTQETKPQESEPAKESEESETVAEKMTIGFANTNDIYPYLVKVRTYVQELAAEEGIEVLVANAAGDVNTQVGQIETFVTQGAEAVICVPADPAGISPTADSLWEKAIPFLTVCGNSETKEIHVGSLNYDAGVMQAQYLAEVMPENAKVLYMHADPNQEMNDRRDGFMTLLEQRPDIELLSEQNSRNMQDLGMSITEAWVQSYDQFDAIVCQNDDSALGAVEALKAANRLEGVTVVGLDGSDPALESIKGGELATTAFQDAEGQAKALVSICVQLRDGVEPDAIEDAVIPFRMITADNVDSVM